MTIATLERLLVLRGKYGYGIFGKIAQKLPALSFWEAGAIHVTERGVQGVDIDFDLPGHAKKHALEVKTTEGLDFTLDQANIDALADREKDGRTPLVAALRLCQFEQWVIAEIPLVEILPGCITLDRLRAYRVKEIEEQIDKVFDNVVRGHFEATLSRGEKYLKEELWKKNTKFE